MERFATLSEITLACEIAGEGPRLVWCHGLASCRDGDRDMIDALAEHFTVLAYDARGHGRSAPVRDESGMNYPAMSRDLRELLAHVEWDRAILAGSSMGAAAAIRVALEEPARAAAVVMIRPASSGQPAPERLRLLFRLGAAAIRSGGIDAALEFLRTIPEAAESLEQDPARIDALRRDWGRHDQDSIAAALEGIPASAPITPELDIAALAVPALVIPGDDPIHPTAAGLECARIIPGAKLAGPFEHVPRAEQVALVVDALRRFVKDAGVDPGVDPGV